MASRIVVRPKPAAMADHQEADQRSRQQVKPETPSAALPFRDAEVDEPYDAPDHESRQVRGFEVVGAEDRRPDLKRTRSCGYEAGESCGSQIEGPRQGLAVVLVGQPPSNPTHQAVQGRHSDNEKGDRAGAVAGIATKNGVAGKRTGEEAAGANRHDDDNRQQQGVLEEPAHRYAAGFGRVVSPASNGSHDQRNDSAEHQQWEESENHGSFPSEHSYHGQVCSVTRRPSAESVNVNDSSWL